MICQMMVALLHSNGQLRTERYGDTEKGCQKPAVQPKTTTDDDDDDDDTDRKDISYPFPQLTKSNIAINLFADDFLSTALSHSH